MNDRSGNAKLIVARQRKKDEFYTQLCDIESELFHYKNHFENAIVYCNCDEPEESNFCKYFYDNFRELKLKKLIVTGFRENQAGVGLFYNGLKSENFPLNGDGNFLSDECTSLLREADIVVTNPPFSLFREYIAQLVNENKKFIVIGNMNALTYKGVFNLFKQNMVWLGTNRFGEFNGFVVPENYDLFGTKSQIDENGNRIIKTNNTCWFTNLKISRPRKFIELTNTYSQEKYPSYDNYEAIEVSRVSEIPCDYQGVMGVPITFIPHYNPEQFEIVGWASGKDEFDIHPTKKYIRAKQHNQVGSVVKGTKVNTRAALHHHEMPKGVFYTAENVEGYLTLTYARIFIKPKF